MEAPSGLSGQTGIIDAHTHVFPAEMVRDRETLCAKEAGFASIYGERRARMVGVEALLASMDASGIERSVLCGFSWEDPDRCALHNEYLLESTSRFPERLIPFLSLPMAHPDRSMKELTRGWEAGARGVGELAFYHREMTPRDLATMKPVLAFMEERGIPLLLHTNETLGHDYPGKGRTSLQRFYELIVSFPRLTLILAHWGAGLPFYALMPEVARTMAHVYYDTAASPFLYVKEIYSVVARIVGPEKILFGTDFPLLSPERYFQELKTSGLNEEDRNKILGGNISRLLGIGKDGER